MCSLLGEKTEVYTLKSGLSLSPRVSIPKILILLRFFLFIYRSQLFPSLIPSFPHFLSPFSLAAPELYNKALAYKFHLRFILSSKAKRGCLINFIILIEHHHKQKLLAHDNI